MRVLVEGIARARAEFLQIERGVHAGAAQAAAGAVRAHRSRSTRTCAGCRSSSIARCRWPPASRPTSRRSSPSLDDPLRIAYLLASLLDMKAEDKQKLLEENSLAVKLDAVVDGAVARDRGARAEGPDRVAAEKEMTDAQRQYVLRQQMKAIQTELGEGDSEVAGAPQARHRGAPARARSRRSPLREVDRLERMTPASPEYQMIRTYLDWVLDVPWDKTDRGSARSRRGAPRPRRGPLRSRQGQGAHRRVPRGAEAAAAHPGGKLAAAETDGAAQRLRG